MAPLPTILLVHGAWHTPRAYEPLTRALEARNFKTICPLLPSCNPALPPTHSLAEDVSLIRSIATRLIEDEGQEVVAIAHSYGGVVVTDALAGLGWAQKSKEGKNGGVVNLVYLAAFIPRAGQSLAGLFGEDGPPPMVKFSDDEIVISTVPDGAPWFYNDLPASEAAYWAKQLVRQPKSASLAPVTHEAWRELPVSYIVCEKDVCFPPAVQRRMADAIVQLGVKVDVQRVDGSHSPFLSMPQVLAEVVWRIVRGNE